MNIIESNLPDGLVHAQAARPTRIRYVILFFILVATIVSYVDRTNLGIAAPFMSKELTLDKAQMGQIFAAFGLTSWWVYRRLVWVATDVCSGSGELVSRDHVARCSKLVQCPIRCTPRDRRS